MVAPVEPRVAPETATVYAAEELALQKLVKLLDSEHQEVVLKAAGVISKYAAERRRNETRLAVEKLRAEVALAKAEARRAERADDEADAWVNLDPAARKEMLREWDDAVAASKPYLPRPRVYLWGGKGPVGNGALPDESDTRVRLLRDDTDRGNPLFWAVPDDKIGSPHIHIDVPR